MNWFIRIFPLLFTLSLYAQDPGELRPKLVVGLVIDQLTNEQLMRNWDQFDDGGFKRLIGEGSFFPNTMYEHTPTATGPGHATIYTGTYPRFHGIVANAWSTGNARETVGCVEDTNKQTIGSTSADGQCSPRFLMGSTIGDQLKLAYGYRSKVVSISLKDRGAVLPGGHAADLAIWFDDETGRWISSNYYADSLPTWVRELNETNLPEKYLSGIWSFDPGTDLFSKEYRNHAADRYELLEKGPPYDLALWKKKMGFKAIRYLPHGNTLTLEAATKAVSSMELGFDSIPDLLAISASSTDYLGHQFGPSSAEVDDSYVQLDSDIAAFLKYLDKEIGASNYIVFVTSDHGVMENAAHMKEFSIPSGLIHTRDLEAELKANFRTQFGTDKPLLGIMNRQVCFATDHADFQDEMIEAARLFLITQDRVDQVLTISEACDDPAYQAHCNGYFKGRSGQLFIRFSTFTAPWYYERGAGHGSPYGYDSRVPMIWYGKNIRSGVNYKQVPVTTIASTLADFFWINRPPFANTPSITNRLLK